MTAHSRPLTETATNSGNHPKPNHQPRTPGETVARAKRTDRAAARRRYRAEQQAAEDALDETTDGVPEAAATAKPRSDARSQAPSPQGRVGIGTAFRLSFRPLDVRGDVAALPHIAIHSKALWLPSLLVVGSTVAFAITAGQDIVTQFLFAYFIQTPAIGGVFLAGFLAPRASWLLGAIVGLLSAVCYSTLILTVFASSVTTSANPNGATQTIMGAFLLSPVMGAFFASAAAWYRRFLMITNPNRNQARSGKSAKADGRSRTAGSQKANARH